jgi:hypothetical protein
MNALSEPTNREILAPLSLGMERQERLPYDREEMRRRTSQLGERWASQYKSLWALQEAIEKDAAAWSSKSAGELIRGISTPHRILAIAGLGMIALGLENLIASFATASDMGLLHVALLAPAGLVLTAFGLEMLDRYVKLRRRHRARMGVLREELRQELERYALAAVDRRRERIAGPRRPVPRHLFEDLLPVQAERIVAGWMRHLGELDTRDADEQHGNVHVYSSQYIARVWPRTSATPEEELSLLESAALESDRKPLLFSLGSFSAPMIARANRTGVGLFGYQPWAAKISARNVVAERYLARGLRDTDGMSTRLPGSAGRLGTRGHGPTAAEGKGPVVARGDAPLNSNPGSRRAQ